MALLTTWTAANRVITTGKVVTYSRRKIYGHWEYLEVGGILKVVIESAYEYHRYCSKTYSYVGLTQAAAAACVEAMIKKYTRDVLISEFKTSGNVAGTFIPVSGGQELMAEIALRRTAGNMWQVDISVREDDSRINLAAVTPSSLFATENKRDYDEG